MRTRSQSHNNFPQQEASLAIVEPLRIELPFQEDQIQEDPPEDPPEVPMADNRTMVELLQAPTEANNFELKHGLINLVQNKQFFEHDKEDPHAHIRCFNKITSTMRVLNDLLNSDAGGYFLDKMPRGCLKIIKRKSKVRQSRAKAVVAKVSMSSSTPTILSDVAELKDMVRALLLDKKNQSSAPAPALAPTPTPAPVKAGQNLQIQMANLTDMLSKFMSSNTASSSGSRKLPSNTITNPKEDLKGITTRSGVAYQGPTIPTPSKVVKQGTEVTKDQVQNSSSQRMDECLVLADLGASINLMPLSMWEGLSLLELTPTCMTLKLTDRSVSKPIGIAKDVSVKVGVFHFPADFMVVDFEPDPRVPLILERYFLKSGRALIDVHKGELTLRIVNEAVTYNLYQTSRYSANYNQMTANKIDVIDMAYEEYSQEVLGFSDVTMSGSPTPYDDPIVSITSPTLTPFGDCDFLLFEEADAFLGLEDDPNSPEFNPFYYDPEGDILLLEALLNSEPLPLLPNHEQYMPSFKKELKVCEAKTIKSSVDEPPEVELKDLPLHLEYAFLEGDNRLPVIIAKELGDKEKSALIKGGFIVVENEENELIPTRLVTGWRRLAGNEYYCFLDGFSRYFQIPIDPRDQVKTTFTCPYGMFAYRRMPFGLCNAPGTFQRCMLDIFHDMVEKTMEIFMDDFLGIVLGHKIFKNGIEVDKAKVDVISKLPHPITVKGAVLGKRHEKHFRPIHYASKMITDAESNYTTTEKEMLAVVYAFEKFWSYLIMNKSIVHTDHSALKYLFAKKDAKTRLLRWVLLLQEFDFKVLDTKGAENLAADHLSRLENPYKNKLLTFLKLATMDPRGDIMVLTSLPGRSLMPVSFGPPFTRMPTSLSKTVTRANDKENFHNMMRCLRTQSKFVKSLTFGALTLWARSRLHEGTNIFSWPLIICRNGLKRKRSSPMTLELFVMLKYGVTYRLSTVYYLQTSGQVEVSNRGLKRSLKGP
nr:reverse transcriptase domain-containing protein [Tanacetum cinerariifolium]